MQNKATAMKKLQNILYQKEFNKDMSTISTDRKFQVHFAILTMVTRWTKWNYVAGGKYEPERKDKNLQLFETHGDGSSSRLLRHGKLPQDRTWAIPTTDFGMSDQVGRISDWLSGQQGFSVLENFGAELRAEERRVKLASLLQEESGEKSKRNKKSK